MATTLKKNILNSVPNIIRRISISKKDSSSSSTSTASNELRTEYERLRDVSQKQRVNVIAKKDACLKMKAALTEMYETMCSKIVESAESDGKEVVQNQVKEAISLKSKIASLSRVIEELIKLGDSVVIESKESVSREIIEKSEKLLNVHERKMNIIDEALEMIKKGPKEDSSSADASAFLETLLSTRSSTIPKEEITKTELEEKRKSIIHMNESLKDANDDADYEL